MKIGRPKHATVVAYLALFAALCGSAYAVSKVGTTDLKRNAVTSAKIRNGTISANDLKRPVVRKEFAPVGGDGRAAAVANCKKNQQMIAGSGGWNTEDSAAAAPTIGRAATLAKRRRPSGFVISGRAPAQANTLVAQVICLPK